MIKKIIKIGGSQGVIIKSEEMEQQGLVIGDNVKFELEKIKLDTNWKNEPATEKQVEFLRKMGYQYGESITKGEADMVIRENYNKKQNTKKSQKEFKTQGEEFPDY